MDLNSVIRVLGRVTPKTIYGVGTVKFYDNTSGKQFGFIQTTQNTDVFIHGSRCVELVAGYEDLPLKVGAGRVDGVLVFPPKRNDQVLFIAEQGPKNIRAVVWTKWDEEEYEAILQEIRDRPLYRLIKRKGHKLASKLWNQNEKTTIWTGKNPFDRTERLYDNNDGAIYFEVKTQNGWESCEDPRAVLTT